jgi:hypothetical protein
MFARRHCRRTGNRNAPVTLCPRNLEKVQTGGRGQSKEPPVPAATIESGLRYFAGTQWRRCAGALVAGAAGAYGLPRILRSALLRACLLRLLRWRTVRLLRRAVLSAPLLAALVIEKARSVLRAFCWPQKTCVKNGRRKGAGGLRPERRAFNSRPDIFMPGVLQRGREIFLALAFEFFLRGFEAGNARNDFFPLQSGVIWLFGHAHPF